MKKNLMMVLGVLIIIGIIYFAFRKEAVAPVMTDSNLVEKTSVENYLRENISRLSPVSSVLGGSWYVVSMTLDLEKNSGKVTYEDGHVQERRDFTYTLDEKNEVKSMTIE